VTFVSGGGGDLPGNFMRAFQQTQAADYPTSRAEEGENSLQVSAYLSGLGTNFRDRHGMTTFDDTRVAATTAEGHGELDACWRSLLSEVPIPPFPLGEKHLQFVAATATSPWLWFAMAIKYAYNFGCRPSQFTWSRPMGKAGRATQCTRPGPGSPSLMALSAGRC
jgi:hypothetical protein